MKKNILIIISIVLSLSYYSCKKDPLYTTVGAKIVPTEELIIDSLLNGALLDLGLNQDIKNVKIVIVDTTGAKEKEVKVLLNKTDVHLGYKPYILKDDVKDYLDKKNAEGDKLNVFMIHITDNNNHTLIKYLSISIESSISYVLKDSIYDESKKKKVIKEVSSLKDLTEKGRFIYEVKTPKDSIKSFKITTYNMIQNTVLSDSIIKTTFPKEGKDSTNLNILKKYEGADSLKIKFEVTAINGSSMTQSFSLPISNFAPKEYKGIVLEADTIGGKNYLWFDLVKNEPFEDYADTSKAADIRAFVSENTGFEQGMKSSGDNLTNKLDTKFYNKRGFYGIYTNVKDSIITAKNENLRSGDVFGFKVSRNKATYYGAVKIVSIYGGGDHNVTKITFDYKIHKAIKEWK